MNHRTRSLVQYLASFGVGLVLVTILNVLANELAKSM